jgi:tRNA (guanine37-N1)-methyltransferase
LLFFAPYGQVLSHAVVSSWAASETGAVLLCGRYEGVDQRFIDAHVDGYISLGDFVLSGGEIPAMAFLDALARLQPGVLHDPESHAHDSFNPSLDGLLDCPHYTRPELWQGQSVPEALMSGHHGHIDRWRRQQSLSQTAQLRPDLIATARDQQKLTPEDEACLAATARGGPFGKTGL